MRHLDYIFHIALGALISLLCGTFAPCHAAGKTPYNQNFFNNTLTKKLKSRFGATDTRRAWIEHDWMILDHDSTPKRAQWGNVVRTIAEHHVKRWARSNELAQAVDKRRKVSLGSTHNTQGRKNGLKFDLEIGDSIKSTLRRGQLRCGMSYNPWDASLNMELRHNISKNGTYLAVQHNTKSFQKGTSMLALTVPF